MEDIKLLRSHNVYFIILFLLGLTLILMDGFYTNKVDNENIIEINPLTSFIVNLFGLSVFLYIKTIFLCLVFMYVCFNQSELLLLELLILTFLINIAWNTIIYIEVLTI